MTRPRTIACLSAAACVLATGCGEDDDKGFTEDYNEVTAALIRVSKQVNPALADTKGKDANKRLAARFDGFADTYGRAGRQFDRLDPPDEAVRPFGRMKAATKRAETHFRELARAARKGNQKAALAALDKLRADGAAQQRAERELGRALE